MISSEDQLLAAFIILAAKHKIGRNKLVCEILGPLGLYSFVPHNKRKPITHIIQKYFLPHPPTTELQVIKYHSCLSGLFETTSQETYNLIVALETNRTPWINDYNNSHIHHSSHSTVVQENISSTNLTEKLKNLKIYLDQLRSHTVTR